MNRVFAHARALAALALITVLLSGCATVGYQGGGADADGLLNAIVADQVGPLKSAIESGRVSVNQRIPAPVYAEGTPLLTIAARAGSLEVLRYLIRAGADVNARTPAGETALMLAAYFRDEDASGNARFARHERAVHLLVEAGAVIDNDFANYAPLSYAAYQGHDHIIRYLLQRGALVDGYAPDGLYYVNTPLMMAAMQGHRSAVQLLLQAGANPALRVKDGHTAAELAAKYNGGSLVTVLRCAETRVVVARTRAPQTC